LRKALLITFLLLSISSCSSDESEIKDLLLKRWKALENKDIALYSECISPDYPRRDELIERIKNNFTRLDNIKIIPQEPVIYIDKNIATVYQEIRVIITIKEQSQEFNSREKLILKKNNGWKIINGLD